MLARHPGPSASGQQHASRPVRGSSAFGLIAAVASLPPAAVLRLRHGNRPRIHLGLTRLGLTCHPYSQALQEYRRWLRCKRSSTSSWKFASLRRSRWQSGSDEPTALTSRHVETPGATNRKQARAEIRGSALVTAFNRGRTCVLNLRGWSDLGHFRIGRIGPFGGGCDPNGRSWRAP
jgi:hypothetical protein